MKKVTRPINMIKILKGIEIDLKTGIKIKEVREENIDMEVIKTDHYLEKDRGIDPHLEKDQERERNTEDHKRETDTGIEPRLEKDQERDRKTKKERKKETEKRRMRVNQKG